MHIGIPKIVSLVAHSLHVSLFLERSKSQSINPPLSTATKPANYSVVLKWLLVLDLLLLLGYYYYYYYYYYY